MTSRPATQWTLEQISSQSRKVFLVALPFAVLFWVYGLGFDTGEADGRTWLNLPAVIGIVGFVVWVGSSLLILIRQNF